MGGVAVRPRLLCFFCPILKISSCNPYLKILDLTKLFVADAPVKKKKYLKKELSPVRAL